MLFCYCNLSYEMLKYTHTAMGEIMKEKLNEFFEKLNIEYFGVLKYSDCQQISERIISRAGFVPKSVILYLVPYYTGDTDNISRYASSLDYHIVLREINEKLERYLSAEFKNSVFKGYGDHSPIDERRAALDLGLGILGESGLLLNEKYGSYIFIGDLVTDIDPEILGAVTPMPMLKCEGCGLCKKACPTGILRDGGGECLSWITQKKGELSKEEQLLMQKYNTAWGCDICQSACPHNKNPKKTPMEFFYRDRIERLTRNIVDAMDKESFEKRAFAWRGRKTVERNIEILEKQENINA